MVKKISEVAFLTGQPLGYYGSWSLFSLSHHYIVWLATLKAYPLRSTPFVDYDLVGDDILITDKKVANQHSRLLDRLSVTISFAKSIVFENGTIEFAKRFWIRDMQKHISPISLKALTSCRTTVGLCQLSCRYSIEISTLQRLAGAGYKVRSRLMSTQSPRWERLKAAAWLKVAPQSLLKAKIIDYLREAVKPKLIQIFPKDLVFDGEREILERAVILNLMKQWLTWLSWYHTVALSPDVTIDQLFDVPICATSWKRSNEDYELINFGYVWKCYDMGAGWNLSTTPRWLFGPPTLSFILVDQ
uniref:Reverse transcriptase domain-containing protein n=1 Tax=Solanum lycopersicum TaxID=4081 RepID=K4D966_SOLLC